MRLLLDTHIWLWALEQPQKLSLKVRRELDRPANELFLSPVSVWEARHVYRKGKLRTRAPFAMWLDSVMQRVTIQEAAFTFSAAAEAAEIRLPQSDLGDVYLAATALAYDLTLVTADEQLLACKWLKTLSND